MDAPLHPPTPVEPWRVALADGELCARFTGTMPAVGETFAPWYCESPSEASLHGVVTRIVSAAWE